MMAKYAFFEHNWRSDPSQKSLHCSGKQINYILLGFVLLIKNMSDHCICVNAVVTLDYSRYQFLLMDLATADTDI